MKKISKYLIPYSVSILFCLLMLFTQAICDLNLPNLMSNIVNIGIQQNGIEHSSPEAISENCFQLITSCLLKEEKDIVTQSYTLIQSSDATSKYQQFINKYPLLKNSNIYVLNDTANRDTLDNYFSSAVSNLLIILQDLNNQHNNISQSSYSNMKMDLNSLYSIIPYIKNIPTSKLLEIKEQANNIDSSLRNQISIQFTRTVYTELDLNLNKVQTNYTYKIGFKMLLITLISAAATIAVSYLSSKISSQLARSLRHDVFEKVEQFSNPEFDKFSVASLITRTTNDITQVQMLILMMIRMIGYALFMGIGGIIMAINKSLNMSWIIALSIIVLACLILIIFSIAKPKFKVIQSLIDRINLVAKENLSGVMVIRAFSNQEFEENLFDNANKELTLTNRFVNRVISLMNPAMMFLLNSTTLLIIWIGAHHISESKMLVGDMIAFMQYAMQVILSFLIISIMFIMFPRAAVSAERVCEVLETEPSIKNKKDIQKLNKNISGKIEFKHVYFKYGNASENVLSDISFTANPGETTAIIGSTGSGKSTILNLIPRFYDVSNGEILIDGIDIRNINQHELRKNIGYIPQRGVLFSGDIYSNLRYGNKNISDTKIREISKVSQSLDFIEKKEAGFNAPIAQGGSNISGGQKQRLSIARALAIDPKIYLFDDSFSALDMKTDANLRKSLKKYTNNATVIIVAQRVSTIIDAEKIIVLDEGKMVGVGTHDELLKTCQAYYEIAQSQLLKEDLQ